MPTPKSPIYDKALGYIKANPGLTRRGIADGMGEDYYIVRNLIRAFLREDEVFMCNGLVYPNSEVSLMWSVLSKPWDKNFSLISRG